MSHIAIAAATKYTAAGESGPWYDDQGLQEALAARGHDVAIISWRDSAVDLLSFDAIFVSSTWDGCDDPAAFHAWLAACECDGRQRLINRRDVLEDGFTKYRYMNLLKPGQQEQASGIITPSRLLSGCCCAAPPGGGAAQQP